MPEDSSIDNNNLLEASAGNINFSMVDNNYYYNNTDSIVYIILVSPRMYFLLTVI